MQETTVALLAQLQDMQKHLPAGPVWLNDFRQAGLERFSEAGLPTHKTETWKYTRVKAEALQQHWNFPARPDGDYTAIIQALTQGLDSHHLVFVNGVYQAALSATEALPQGVILEPLDKALQQHADLVHRYLDQAVPQTNIPFAGINSGLMANGLFLFLPENCVVDKPVNILLLNSDAGSNSAFSVHPRLLIAASSNSQAEVIVQEATGSDKVKVLNNVVTEIILDAGSRLKYSKLQNQLDVDMQLSATYVKQARDSNFESHTISCGGQLIRNDLHIQLAGPGANCSLNGIYVASDKQHIDNHTVIEHMAPHCNSQEFYKGLMMDQSRAVFNGRIHIHPDAQKTSGDMQNRNLLLSKLAEVDTKPELEIYADDVQCRHGATVGDLDEKQLFLLQARGLSKSDATSILSLAFINEILERLPYESIKQHIQNLIEHKLKTTTK